MRVIISAAVSADGYLDDTTTDRLILSNRADWREVHALRARCDGILVGAETLRKDDPALIIRDPALRKERIESGRPADITKITITSSGNLDTALRFFSEGPAIPKILFIENDAPEHNIARLAEVAEVVRLRRITAKGIVGELASRGIDRLMVEGGAGIIKMFLDEDAADEFRLALSPVVVADAEAPRLPYFGKLPFEEKAVKNIRNIGDMTVTEYTIHTKAGSSMLQDRQYLQRAIDLSRNCTLCGTAYSVGCVIVCASGEIFEGHTHETGPHNHAEEEAILKAKQAGADLKGAVIYTSMEPCSTRKSKPVSCTGLILENGFERVVYAYAEPECFVRCEGTAILRNAGINVEVLPEMAEQVRRINSHIIGG